jgi:ribosomal protein L7/L12
VTSELDRFKTILATICLTNPEAGLSSALLAAYEVEKQMQDLPLERAPWEPDWSDFEQAARWAKQDVEIRDFMLANQRVHAIKRLREISKYGLKDSKDVLEIAYPAGHLSF